MAIDKIVVIGASVMRKAWHTDADAGSAPTRNTMRTALLAEGVDLPFYSYANSGDTAAQTNSAIDAILVDFDGESNVGFLVHAGGNDFSSNGAYSGWSQSQKDDLSDEIESICQKIIAAGHQVILCPLSYRNYTYAITDEEDGTKGANEEIYYPLIATYSSDWWDSVNSLPIMNIYKVIKDNANDFFAGVDPIHPAYPVGTAILQQYFAETLTANAVLPQWDGKERVLCSVSSSLPPNGNAVTADNGSILDLVDSEGNVISGSSFSLAGFAAASSNQGKANPANIAWNVVHRDVTQHYVYTQDTATITISLGEDYAGRTGDVYISGARMSSATDRVAEFTVGGNSDTVDAALDDPEFATLPFTLDSSGTLTIGVAEAAGSTYAYFSGALLELDADTTPQAPAMPSDTSVSINEGSTAPIGTYAAVSGTEPITYSLTGADAALFTVNSSTAQLSPASGIAHNSGGSNTYVVNVVGTNSEGSDSTQVTVTVLQVAVPTPPAISSVTGARAGSFTIAGSGFTGTSAVTINGVAATSFSVVSDTSITGVWPQDIDAAFNTSVNVVVTNPDGSDTESVTWLGPVGQNQVVLTSLSTSGDIYLGNQAGIFTPNIAIGDVISYRPTMVGTDGEGTFSFAISAAGEFSFGSGVAQGAYQIEFGIQDASDDYAWSGTVSQFVEIVIDENNAPVLVSAIPEQAVTAGIGWSINVASYFDDADGDTLTFSKVSGPSNIEVSSAGLVTPTSVGSGSPYSASAIPVVVQANDGAGGTVNGTVSINTELVSVGTISFAPVANATRGQTYTATSPIAGLAEGARIEFSGAQASVNGGASYSSSSPVYVGSSGAVSIRASVTASANYDDSESVLVNVNGSTANFVVTTGENPSNPVFVPDGPLQYFDAQGALQPIENQSGMKIAIYSNGGIQTGDLLYSGTFNIGADGTLPTVESGLIGEVGDGIEVIYRTPDNRRSFIVNATVTDGNA